MAKQFKLPELGEGVDEGEVVLVLVNEGDTVSDGDGVIEVESDKATAEVPIDADGKVTEVHVAEGDTVRPGDPILSYEPGGGEGDESDGETSEAASDEEKDKQDGKEKPEKRSGKKKKEKTKSQRQSEDKESPPAEDEAPEDEADESEEDTPDALQARGAVMATPSVRTLARELGVNIHAVEGSGPSGRILEDDVKAFARRLVQAGGGPRGEVSPLYGEAPDYDEYGPVRRERMNGIRRTTAKRMAAIWPAVPRVTNFEKAAFGAVEDVRARLADRGGTKVSLTAILVKLIAQALKAHPKLNASVDVDRQQVVYHDAVHMGVAVDTARGLLVPVVKDADRKGVTAIHDQLAGLADRARDGKLPAEAMQGATFTLSNLGGLGGGWFTPIVNAPEVAILGIGRARTEPVWDDGEGAFRPAPLCPLSLSYDHRLVDGADAARFLGGFVDMLEHPLLTLLQGETT
ncbi:MAG: dihydrolipoamide acetyltransferase family protein [Planctomycetota bacterium]